MAAFQICIFLQILEEDSILSNFLQSNSYYLLILFLSKTIDYFGDFVGKIIRSTMDEISDSCKNNRHAIDCSERSVCHYML